MIADNMCPKDFCFHKTTEHIMMYRLEKISRLLTSDITLCVVCVFVTIFRCLMVANRSRTTTCVHYKEFTRRDRAYGSFLLIRWDVLFAEHIKKIFLILHPKKQMQGIQCVGLIPICFHAYLFKYHLNMKWHV